MQDKDFLQLAKNLSHIRDHIKELRNRLFILKFLIPFYKIFNYK